MAAIKTSRFDLSPQNELLISRVIQERKANHVIRDLVLCPILYSISKDEQPLGYRKIANEDFLPAAMFA